MVYESYRSSRGFTRGTFSPRGRSSYSTSYSRGIRGIAFKSERGNYRGNRSSPSRSSGGSPNFREHRGSYSGRARGGGHYVSPRDNRRNGSPYSRSGGADSPSSYSRGSRYSNDEGPSRKRYHDDDFGPSHSEGYSSSYKGRTSFEGSSRYSGARLENATTSYREKESNPREYDSFKRPYASRGSYRASRGSFGTSRGSFRATRGVYRTSRGSYGASGASYGASGGYYGTSGGYYGTRGGSYRARGSYVASRGFRSTYSNRRGFARSYPTAGKFGATSRISKYQAARPVRSSKIMSEHALHKMRLMEKLRMRNAARGIYSHFKKDANSEKESKDDEKEGGSPMADMGSGDEDEDKAKDDDDRSEKKTSANDEDCGEFKMIKLRCVHCDVSCRTFRQYEYHLSSLAHRRTLSRVIERVKRKIYNLRLEQRQEQRIVDNEDKDSDSHNFCNLCKLHYRQSTFEHFVSDSHLSMSEIMNPRCEICKITFTTPIIHQHHRCSLPHIKRKAFLERKGQTFDEGGEQENAEGEEKFMVLDSVGSADEDSGGDEEEQDSRDDGKKKITRASKPKKSSNIGIEYIKKVNAYYCELCVMCLPYRPSANQEDALITHCHGRMHLSKYTAAKRKLKERKAAKADRKDENSQVESEDENNKDGEEEEEGSESEEREETEQRGSGAKMNKAELLKISLEKLLQSADSSDEEEDERMDEEEEEGRGGAPRFDRFGQRENDDSGHVSTTTTDEAQF